LPAKEGVHLKGELLSSCSHFFTAFRKLSINTHKLKTRFNMKYYIACILLFILPIISLHAQTPYNAASPNGYTKKAKVAEQIGLTDVSITYHRPAVNGREGKIWGSIVHRGFTDQGFGNRKPAPWRAGANENTVIEFSNDVKLEGQSLPKGKYGLFIAYDSLESTVIISRRTDAWGSFFYDEKDDVLRVKVKPVAIDKSVEHLKYEFLNQTQNSAVIALSWEKLSIPFKVEVDHLKQQFDAFVAESQNPAGFTSQSLNIAANWCLQNNYRLDKALEWATLASGQNFPGDPNSFAAHSTKALILCRLNKNDEAAAAIKAASAVGNVVQLQQFGRQLIAAKNPKAALEVFQFNLEKHPNQFITLTGMIRGLSANGNYTKAIEFADLALPLAPNDANKQAVQNMIQKLKEGKDVN
jgi:tetratricopeptide (TPR) repeat protein